MLMPVHPAAGVFQSTDAFVDVAVVATRIITLFVTFCGRHSITLSQPDFHTIRVPAITTVRVNSADTLLNSDVIASGCHVHGIRA